jgi:hypothetical protein
MHTFGTQFLKSCAIAVPLLMPLKALAGGTDCVIYATDYANAHTGSGDLVGDTVSGGMAGAVAGGAWDPLTGGAERGARAGGALGVLNNLGSIPQGWQALYDMAYQMCLQQTSGAYAAPYQTGPALDCRSSANVDAPMEKAPDGSIFAGSNGRNCR